MFTIQVASRPTRPGTSVSRSMRKWRKPGLGGTRGGNFNKLWPKCGSSQRGEIIRAMDTVPMEQPRPQWRYVSKICKWESAGHSSGCGDEPPTVGGGSTTANVASRAQLSVPTGGQQVKSPSFALRTNVRVQTPWD